MAGHPMAVRVSPDGHELTELMAELLCASSSQRTLLGLAGPPGVGKSTLAAALATAYGVPVVPLDGFHRPEAELRALGRLHAKGAPDTFDAEGYAALLARLRAGGTTVLAPAFHHGRPDPEPDAIEVPAAPSLVVTSLVVTSLVVTEGNYLLLDEPRWRAARSQLDAVWHLATDQQSRVERLVRRHDESGKPPDQARAWVEAVDEPNARLVEAASHRADVILDLSHWSGTLRGRR